MNMTGIYSDGPAAYCISGNQLYSFTLNTGISLISSFAVQLSAIGDPSLLGTQKNGFLLSRTPDWIQVLPPVHRPTSSSESQSIMMDSSGPAPEPATVKAS